MAADDFSHRSRVYSSNPRPRRSGGLSPFSRLGTAVALAAVVATAAGLAHVRHARNERRAEPTPAPDQVAAAEAASAFETDLLTATDITPSQPLTVETRVLRKNETLYDTLVSVGFHPQEIWALVTAAKPFHNLSRVSSGMQFTVWKQPDLFGTERVVSFQMSIAANKTLLARPSVPGPVLATSYDAEVREIPYTTQLTGYTGTVESSLWQSMDDAGIDTDLIAELADVFAFDIDFTREVRPGDKYRLVVEERFLEGKHAGFGRILAAEYVAGKESHSAIQFAGATGGVDYFATDGSSLRRLFLRSPLRYSRISSRFGGRFHPTLGVWKKHEGVDYAAPRGTAIRSVGDGTVTAASYNGASGNFVKLRHNGTYETSYSHLSGYAPGVKSGSKVTQGQVIGYVGTTGRSTGPHLHFAFYEKGRYIDPLSKRFPAAEPVPAKEKERFEKAKTDLMPLLPAWPEDTTTASTTTMVPVPPALVLPR